MRTPLVIGLLVALVGGGCRRARPRADEPVAAAAPSAARSGPAVDAGLDAAPGPDAGRYLAYRAAHGGNAGYPDRAAAQPFGYKMGWLAVPTTDRERLIAQLGLGAAHAVPFVDAMDAAYDGTGTMVVSVDGWTLVVGAGVLTADATRLERLVVTLSAEHGEAQALLTHRYFEYHGYVLAREGRLVRSYVYDGERKGVVRDVGARLPEEAGLPSPFDGPAFMTPSGMIGDGRLPPEARHEGDVMIIARAWSLSPLDLGGRAHPVDGPTLLAAPLALE